MLTLFALEIDLAGATDYLVGGGIVGGILTAAKVLYDLWDKRSRRRTEVRNEATDSADKELELDQRISAAVRAEYEHLLDARRSAHNADIRALRREIDAGAERIGALEARDTECQRRVTALQKQNGEQAGEITTLRAEVVTLRAEIDRLRARLSDAHIPGAGSPPVPPASNP
jgi:chromosome segregation ATPase